jgi:hypothetical protein
MSTLKRSTCEICGDESKTPVCSDCLREEEYRPIAEAWWSRFSEEINNEALQQMEFPMTKCELCGNYYGPYSMDKHLEEDHGLKHEGESYKSGYRAGKADGENQGYRERFADASSED